MDDLKEMRGYLVLIEEATSLSMENLQLKRLCTCRKIRLRNEWISETGRACVLKWDAALLSPSDEADVHRLAYSTSIIPKNEGVKNCSQYWWVLNWSAETHGQSKINVKAQYQVHINTGARWNKTKKRRVATQAFQTAGVTKWTFLLMKQRLRLVKL